MSSETVATEIVHLSYLKVTLFLVSNGSRDPDTATSVGNPPAELVNAAIRNNYSFE